MQASASAAEAGQGGVAVTWDSNSLRLHGETAALMQYVRERKQGPEASQDTTRDQEWHVDENLRGADRYVTAISLLYIVPKTLALHPPLMLLQLPALLLAYCRLCFIKAPTHVVDRSACGHRAYVATAFVLALPALVLIVASYLVDVVAYYFFSVAYCAATCKWKQYRQSCKVLKPYTGGPGIFAIGDFFVGILGVTWRQGPLETTFMLASTWCTQPWIKYFMNVNPWVYPLEERFVTQISTTMRDMPVSEIISSIDDIIVATKAGEDLRKRIDGWYFAPHYPRPPPWRRYAMGIQGGSHVFNWNLVLFFTHSLPLQCRHGDAGPPFVRSNSCMFPWMRVMLWYNNPYHFLTAWVEANIGTGVPSQMDKPRSGEHPMWIVSSHAPSQCSRDALAGVGMIDAFFDAWLPKFVHTIRFLRRGKDAADELYEGVVSKAGVSRPESHKPVPYVAP